MKNGIIWLTNLWGKNKAQEAFLSWQEVFDTSKPAVQQVLKDLATYCNIYKSSFDTQSAEATAFNEGARDVFLHIMEMLSLDYEEISKF